MEFVIHTYHHYDERNDEVALLLAEMLDLVTAHMESIMASLAETLAAVTNEGTKIDGLIAYTAGIKAQLDAALANTVLSTEVQAQIDAIFAQAKGSADKIDAALNANVAPPIPASVPAAETAPEAAPTP